MGRTNRGKARMPGFVALPWTVLNSPAFLEMTHAARAALPYWLGKPKAPFNKPEYFSNEFAFSYPEAARLGFAKATFCKVLCQVIEHGFVDPVSKGGLKGFGNCCSRFRLSRRWTVYGSKEFQSIHWTEFGTSGQKKAQFKNGNVTGSKTETF
jgi:hypothetical protein